MSAWCGQFGEEVTVGPLDGDEGGKKHEPTKNT